MAGLFDMLGFAPSTQKSIGGFLEMLQGMQSPDNPFRRAREDKQRNDMMQQEREWLNQQRQRQMQEWQQQDQMRSLPGQFMKPAQMPATMDARDIGLPGEQAMGRSFDLPGYIEALKGIDPIKALQLEASMQKAEPSPLVLSPGGMAVDPRTGKTIAQAPFKPAEEKSTDLGRMLAEMNSLPPGSPMRKVYEDAIRKQTTHSPGVSVSYGAPQPGLDPQGNPVFFQPAKGGGAPAIVPGVRPVDSVKPPTEAQAKADTYRSQMEGAERELATTPIDMTTLGSQADVAIAGGLGNLVASPAAQRARQAQEQWAESFLRFKTGAAATRDEVKLNVRTFFPQPGDSREVIEQKARARKQAIEDIAKAGSQPKRGNANVMRFDAQGNPIP